jgi:ribosomal protein S18 acetylase RimI-like enzyme
MEPALIKGNRTMTTKTALTIRPVKSNELPLLKGFAPPEWNSNVAQLFAFFFGQPYFHPIVAELAGEIVGCANGLLNGRTGWLGNIIVLPEYRGQGIGSALTTHLVEYFQQQGCTSQLPVATELGQPVYTKLGFTVSSTYTILRSEKINLATPPPHIRKAQAGDFEPIWELDQLITCEQRTPFRERFLSESWVYQAGVDEPVEGFFLPGLASGPILARNKAAGLELLDFKLGLGCTSIVVPTSNQPALDHLIKTGFKIVNTAPRMFLGAELKWVPAGVFSRGGGFCG